MKLYITLPDLDPEALSILQSVFESVDYPTERVSEEHQLAELVKKYDAIIIGAKEKMTEYVYQSSKTLKMIGTLSSGIDHICDSFIRDKNVHVLRCAKSNVISVAEHTVMLMLVHAKRFRQGEDLLRKGKGRNDLRPLPVDLYKKIVGVIGLGPIGTRVVELVHALGMKPLVYTRTPERHTEVNKVGGVFSDLNDLVEKSDIVTVHLPLTEETRAMFNKDNIPLMRDDTLLINTSRADLVDNIFLLEHMNSGNQLFYAIDVEWEEIPDKLMRDLLDCSNVYMSPHVAGLSRDAMFRMDTDLAKEFKNLLG